MSAQADDILGCLECGLIQRVPELAPTQKAVCRRCGMTLLRHRPNQLRTGLALILGAIILSAPSLLEPLFVANVYGHERSSAVFTGVASLWTDAWWPLALMVLGFVIVIPMVWLCALLFVFLCLEHQVRTPSLPYVFRAAETLNVWVMPDVFLVGAAVAYARMNALASVAVADGGWCFLAFAFIVMAIRTTTDSAEIWNAIERPPALERNAGLLSGLRSRIAAEIC
jgi:paraquat-inducible protein A